MLQGDFCRLLDAGSPAAHGAFHAGENGQLPRSFSIAAKQAAAVARLQEAVDTLQHVEVPDGADSPPQKQDGQEAACTPAEEPAAHEPASEANVAAAAAQMPATDDEGQEPAGEDLVEVAEPLLEPLSRPEDADASLADSQELDVSASRASPSHESPTRETSYSELTALLRPSNGDSSGNEDGPSHEGMQQPVEGPFEVPWPPPEAQSLADLEPPEQAGSSPEAPSTAAATQPPLHDAAEAAGPVETTATAESACTPASVSAPDASHERAVDSSTVQQGNATAGGSSPSHAAAEPATSSAQPPADEAAAAQQGITPEIREFLASQGLEGLLSSSGSAAAQSEQNLDVPARDGGHIERGDVLMESPRDDDLDTDANMLEVCMTNSVCSCTPHVLLQHPIASPSCRMRFPILEPVALLPYNNGLRI